MYRLDLYEKFSGFIFCWGTVPGRGVYKDLAFLLVLCMAGMCTGKQQVHKNAHGCMHRCPPEHACTVVHSYAHSQHGLVPNGLYKETSHYLQLLVNLRLSSAFVPVIPLLLWIPITDSTCSGPVFCLPPDLTLFCSCVWPRLSSWLRLLWSPPGTWPWLWTDFSPILCATENLLLLTGVTCLQTPLQCISCTPGWSSDKYPSQNITESISAGDECYFGPDSSCSTFRRVWNFATRKPSLYWPPALATWYFHNVQTASNVRIMNFCNMLCWVI